MASGKALTEKMKSLKLETNTDVNILLLGESGVGKSTFINSIANYLHFDKLKHAERAEKIQILIPSMLTIPDANMQLVDITVGEVDTNEIQAVGQSGTQDVKTYVFPLGEGGTRIRLIDTPGMGDVRGIEQDNINCENILAYLSQLQHLHAICFLMRPTNTRNNTFFEYCLKEILSRLEKSAVNNIIFIFTNARGANYSPGDTLACLRTLIDQIKARPPHVNIPLRENIFSFDNEAFRYLMAFRNNIKYSDEIRKLNVDSWKRATDECWKMFNYIVGDLSRDGLKPHQIQNTVSINEARRLIVQLSKPLADITELIADNIRILDKHSNNLRMENQTLDELKVKLYMPVMDLEVTKLTQPVTVCTSRKCAEPYKVGELTKWHYKNRCHDPCYLNNIEKDMVGDPGLIHCAAMAQRNTCTRCMCDYSVHMHVYYFTKTQNRNIIDPNVQSNVQFKEAAVQEAKILVDKIQVRKKELEREKEIVIRDMAQFACFLQKNAISPYNDAYQAYINYLIKRERAAGPLMDLGHIYNLEELLRRHEEIKNAFKASLKAQEDLGIDVNTVLTPAIIMERVAALYKLPTYGKRIKEMLQSQRNARNKEYDHSCEYIQEKPAVKKATNEKKSGAQTDTETKTYSKNPKKWNKANKSDDDERRRANAKPFQGKATRNFNQQPQKKVSNFQPPQSRNEPPREDYPPYTVSSTLTLQMEQPAYHPNDPNHWSARNKYPPTYAPPAPRPPPASYYDNRPYRPEEYYAPEPGYASQRTYPPERLHYPEYQYPEERYQGPPRQYSHNYYNTPAPAPRDDRNWSVDAPPRYEDQNYRRQQSQEAPRPKDEPPRPQYERNTNKAFNDNKPKVAFNQQKKTNFKRNINKKQTSASQKDTATDSSSE